LRLVQSGELNLALFDLLDEPIEPIKPVRDVGIQMFEGVHGDFDLVVVLLLLPVPVQLTRASRLDLEGFRVPLQTQHLHRDEALDCGARSRGKDCEGGF
jgi:hypothetical protein